MKIKFYFLRLYFNNRNMAVKEKKSAPNLWKKVLKDRGVKQNWLAEKSGISKEHISNILADRVFLTQENKQKINEVLGTNF